MRLNAPSVALIELVARALEELVNDVVFVGGATTPLYLADFAAQEPRPTEDVDCIIELASYNDFHQLEKKLMAKGFQHSHRHGDPICRWIINSTIVDIMPTNENILGFSNKWYKEGITNAIKIQLPQKTIVSIFTLPYFIAAKIEAYFGRGQNDFRTSHDIEDIITVLDAQYDFKSLESAPETVKSYLRNCISEFLKDRQFIECLSGHIEPGPTAIDRVKRLLILLTEFSQK